MIEPKGGFPCMGCQHFILFFFTEGLGCLGDVCVSVYTLHAGKWSQMVPMTETHEDD